VRASIGTEPARMAMQVAMLLSWWTIHFILLIRIKIEYNLGNPTYMGPRYSRITENDGLVGKVGTNLSIFPDIVYRNTSKAILFS
jgi:hypothetical protein